MNVHRPMPQYSSCHRLGATRRPVISVRIYHKEEQVQCRSISQFAVRQSDIMAPPPVNYKQLLVSVSVSLLCKL